MIGGDQPIHQSADFLHDPALLQGVRELRQLDNYTNWIYLSRVWLFLIVAIGGAISLTELLIRSTGVIWSAAPVIAIAIVLVGAGQHQLAGATHEATHRILFKNKWLNELASDWLCMFPLFSSTFHFRLHHLAHHHYVNDELRDPDFAQLAASGHRFDFPMEPQRFLWRLARSLQPHRLIAYIVQRASINSIGQGANPYRKAGVPTSKAVPILAALFVLMQGGVCAMACRLTSPYPLLAGPIVVWLLGMTFVLAAPRRWQLQTQMRPVIPLRLLGAERITFLTLNFAAISWLARMTGLRFGLYYLVFWIAPIFTSFAFFMILRQVVQHGNGDRGRLTNTRVFFVHRLLRFAIFPFGMDFHLPHHLFATVPHYRLPQLDSLLLTCPQYAANGVRVEGYFAKRSRGQTQPTVLDVLGPRFAGRGVEIYEDEAAVAREVFVN